MENNCSPKNAVKVKNIVISGTGFWNPGDDFVRDGVIKILENLFRGYQLNFLFYNFNQDFFPQNKFSGITNMAAKGDLNQYSEHVDAAVIAGLSAGLEINDLYNWIIDTNLLDRVYLIGAGYENEYVDKHIGQEPAATIFKNARIITGRTRKKPKFISDNNLSYHHVNCPAILSVPNVKDVSQGNRIEKIAFSIQLPHQIGIMNQSCAESMHKLAINILLKLSPDYEIEVIAHHKSEYFYFLKLFHELGLSVPVIFSSFYQDMFNIYRKHDLIIATRLHSCLFGNGHGIPGIVLNDTDRHTHCLEGFPHSIWVNSKDRFDSAFRKIRKWNYAQVAEYAAKFKERLLNHYLSVLAEAFGLNIEEMDTLEEAWHSENLQVPSTSKRKDQDNYGVGKPQSVPDENGGTSNDSYARDLTKRLIDTISGDVDTKRRALNIFNRLTKDYWLEKNIEKYRQLIQNRVLCFDAASFLNWYAENFKPRYYLEIGVRRGRSLAQVLSQSPATTSFGFDIWVPDYGSRPVDGILTSNPGPEFVLQELRNLGCDKQPILFKGNSHQTLPQFWSVNKNPKQIDLIFVDGDHTYAGAKLDMDICFRHLSDGGALVFDDISHPSHPELKQLWKETKVQYPDCIYIEHSYGMGTGVAFKPPFDHLKQFLAKDICSQSVYNASDTERKKTADISTNAKLPVHFFTIVLNGEPFIRYHIDIFKHLSFKWHWHIIEGVADLKHDTAWSLQNGGRISDELHRCGLSNDGTTKYLDELEREYPENITIYRKPGGMFWSGKLEMVNAPLENIHRECLLWQVDADELWTNEQICTGRAMFMAEPDRTAAYYLDQFFVGEDLTISTIDTYGNNTTYEWLRTWRFKPSFRWATHEPPRLCMPTQDSQWIDVSTIKPFKHNETEANGLVFQHYAYATERQLRFKEIYYGYKNGIEGWRSLQKQSNFPVFLREYFKWVKDAAQVDTIASQNIKPLASKDINDQWQFNLYASVSEQQSTPPTDNCRKILFVRTDSIGDNILAMAMIPHIKDKYPKANITILCQAHIAELYEACPFVDEIVTFDRQRSYEDEEYRSSITQKLQAINADIALNSVYSREPLTDVFAIGSGAKERIAFNGNLCNISAEIRDKHNQFYSRLLLSGEEQKQELERNRDFLKDLGIGALPLQPIMWTTHEDEQFAQKLFNGNNINPENTIALFPSAQHHHKVYQHYQFVLQHFQDFDLVVLGGKDAMVQANKICENFRGNCVNLTGKTTICQMASVIRKCRIYLGSDSAGAHVACAVGIPNVVLQGGGHFSRFFPYSPLTSIVCLPLECYRCNWQCPYQKAHCISDISPNVIIEAIRLTLKQPAETPRVVVQKNSLSNPRKGQPKWTPLGQYLGLANVEIISVVAEPYSIDVSDLNMKGENLFAKGDLDGALNLFTKALDLAPENAVTHNNLGVVYYNQGDKEKAFDHYKMAAELQPENIIFQKNLADFYYVEQGQVEEAMQIYVKVLNANPEDIEALLALAHICISLEKFGDATDFYNRILKIEPKNKDAKEFLDKLEKCQLSAAGGQTDQTNNDADSNGYLVSAIVSTYNAERFIRGCLEDLENQTIADRLEIVIVDSGSGQDEESVVKEFLRKYSNIKYIKTENRENVYAAWNRAIKAATGKYITNANTDDRHRRDAFEVMARALDENPEVGAVYADSLITTRENETFDDNSAKYYFRRPNYNLRQMLIFSLFGPHPMWRRSVHEKLGYFDPSFEVAGDYDFFIQLAWRFGALHIRENLGLYTQRESSIENSKRQKCVKETIQILKHYHERIPLEEIYPELSSVSDEKAARTACLIDQGSCCLFGDVPDIENAIRYFHQAFDLGMDAPELTCNLALALYLDGQRNKGIGLLRQQQQLLPQAAANLTILEKYPEQNGPVDIRRFAVADIKHPVVVAARVGHGLKLESSRLIYTGSNDILMSGQEMIYPISDGEKGGAKGKEHKPAVSVIVRTSNRRDFLIEGLKSIANQTFRDLEVVLVNDGGPDVTQVIESYKERLRIVYKRHLSNRGRTAALNTGLRSAVGKYVAYLDDDDIFYPEHIETLITEMEKGDYAVAYTDSLEGEQRKTENAYEIVQRRLVYSQDFDRDLLLRTNYIPILNVMHHRDCLDSVGIFDESLQVLEDWEFWIRLSRKYSFIHIPKVTAEYRVRDDSSNATTAEGHFFPRCRQRIWDRHRKQGPVNSQEEPAKMTSLIILTCNQLAFTKKCIDSIYKHTSEPFELIVVDNGSTDGTISYLEALSKKRENDVPIKIIKNKKNLGFAAGNNQGIAVSVGDYILLMNNDIVVTSGWLDRLIRCAEQDLAIGIVGPLSNYVSGPQLVKDVSYDTQTLTGLNEFAKRFATANSDRKQRLIRVVGFCMLVKRAVIEKIGGMDSAYGLGNFEDDDFSLRAALAGFESWMVQDCFVHHFGSRTFIGEQIDYRESLQKNWEIFKQKWKLPAELSYDSGYSLPLLGVTAFDPSVHYIPYQKAVQLEPANDTFQKNLCKVTYLNKQGEDLFGKGDLEGALDAFKKALEIDRSNATTHNNFGVLYYTQGDKEKALKYYRKAAKLDPENITFQKNLADFYYVEMGQVEEAMHIYVKALNANPEDIETLLVLAHICVALEKFQDAKVFYSRVLEIEPGHQDALQFLDKLNSMNSDNSGAKTPEELYHRVQPMLNNSDPIKAFAALEHLLDKFPNFALAYNDLAVLYYNNGDQESALNHYQKAVQLEPANATFQKNLADYYFVELDRKEEALQIYLRLLNHHPNDLELSLTAAHICVAVQNFSKAKVLYKRVLDIDPENEDAWNNLRTLGKIKGDLRTGEPPKTESPQKSTPEEYSLATETARVNDTSEKDIPQFAIIVPTSAPLKQFLRCVESIKEHISESYEILFVNNGTTKGVLKWVRQCIDENHNWHLVKCGKGANPAVCYNTGIKAARGEYIVLLSNDVVVTDGWLSSMLQCFNSIPDAGMVGTMANRARGPQKVAAAVNTSFKEINAFAETYRATNRYRRIVCDVPDSFCLLFQRDLTQKIGLFDEQMAALGFEDEDYCLRAALEGYVNQIAGDVYLHRLERKAPARSKKHFNLKWSGADIQSPIGKRHLALRAVEKANRAVEEGKSDLAVELFLQAIGLLPEHKENYYKLAEMLVNTKGFKDALDVLNELPEGDPDARHLELAARCQEGLERFEEAERYADRALEINRCAPSALNTKGIIAFRRDDKNAAESYFTRAMETDPGFGEAYTNLGALKWAAGFKDEALSLYERGFILSPTVPDIALNYHSALADLEEYQRAESVVRDAAAVHPRNKKIRYMLIDILLHLQNLEMAMQEIETAIADFGVEDGILSSALKIREKIGPLTMDRKTGNGSTVSLCMIAKDEEEHLARCLQSVRPVVDEIIVVDTGSKDRSRDIARVFGAKVFDFEWAEDFAEARNYSLSKATGKMVFVMDADEVISPLDYELFRQTARQSSRQRSAFIINTRNYTMDNNLVEWVPNEGYYDIEEAGTGWTPSAKIRLFPNDPHIRFDFPVHEMVEPSLRKMGIAMKLCKFQVHHYGKLNRYKSEKKGEAYYEIGCKKLEEMGDAPVALRELAIQAEGLKKHEEAVKLWERFIAIVPNEPKAYINMGISYCGLGQFDKVLTTAEKALKFAPDSKEGHFNRALAKLHLGHPDQAIEILEKLCEEMPEYLPAGFILAAACCCGKDKKRGMVLLKELSRTDIGPGLAIRCHELASRFVLLQRPAYALALLDAAIDSQNGNKDVLDLYADCLKMTNSHPKTGTYE